MDLRTQSSLIAALLSLSLAASVLLRSRKRRGHWLFGIFGLSVSAYYLSSFVARVLEGDFWVRVNLACGVLLPLSAIQFFRAFVGDEHRRMTRIVRAATVTGFFLMAAAFTPFGRHRFVAGAMTLYVGVFLFAALSALWSRSKTAPSRLERARLQYLTMVGGLATIFTLLEYLPYLGFDIPPVGTVLVLVFLYVLSQSIVRSRLVDLYEMAGRLGVLLGLAFMLATMLWLLENVAGEGYFIHSVVAALVVLLLFDPMRTKMATMISQALFRERFDFEQSLAELRSRIAHVLEVDDLSRVLIDGLERSRRCTHASVFLADEAQRGYDLARYFGPEPERRVEAAPARPLLDRLERELSLVLESMEDDLRDLREDGDDREAETVHDIIQTLEALNASVCLAVRSEEGVLFGFLCVRDDRVRDAFSPHEVQLLAGVAAQAALTVENSRHYQRMKERDRLAALGEMAAGLAHEIRNPLGAIKASAQYLTEPGHEAEAGTGEFLGIIVEEVDRLNRVVGSFLDYARPYRGNATPMDVSVAVERTMQLLGSECSTAGVEYTITHEPDLPPVRIDSEQLQQVVINLVRNAVQAMAEGGELSVETLAREREDIGGGSRRWIEVRVSDTGPGIPKDVRANLFVPFVTTKDGGTGLGLAISQRIVNTAGGHIVARTHAGVGTTFIIQLPAAEEPWAAEAQSSEDAAAGVGAGASSSSKPSGSPETKGAGSESVGDVGAEEPSAPDERPKVVTTIR